jgi:glycosyltransferase involved in cell wall biosynthesis
MFHPGIESLPYIFDQLPFGKTTPEIFVRCLAQTIDPDDFVNKTGMTRWMRSYEHMCENFVTGILATSEEMITNLVIAGIKKTELYNISGLSFDKNEVLERVPEVPLFSNRKYQVAWASRWDEEKQPDFFMDLIELEKKQPDVFNYVVLSGGPFRSNDPTLVTRARKLESEGKLTILENLSKNEYYHHLSQSRLLFNCALQDWVSNTVSEADTLGCNVLFPAYRSFPEVFKNDHTRMFVPWSLHDAREKMINLVFYPSDKIGQISDWNTKTIDRILDILLGEDIVTTGYRHPLTYRAYVRGTS